MPWKVRMELLRCCKWSNDVSHIRAAMFPRHGIKGPTLLDIKDNTARALFKLILVQRPSPFLICCRVRPDRILLDEIWAQHNPAWSFFLVSWSCLRDGCWLGASWASSVGHTVWTTAGLDSRHTHWHWCTIAMCTALLHSIEDTVLQKLRIYSPSWCSLTQQPHHWLRAFRKNSHFLLKERTQFSPLF